MNSDKGFYFNAAACTACKVCVMACAAFRKLPEGIMLRSVFVRESLIWQKHTEDAFLHTPHNISVYPVTIACMQCESAPCVDACPAGVLYHENNVVLAKAGECTGCQACTETCPYGALSLDDTTLNVYKCDHCNGLIAENEQPPCAASCNMRALEFGDLSFFKKKYNAVPPSEQILSNAASCMPRLLITPHPAMEKEG